MDTSPIVGDDSPSGDATLGREGFDWSQTPLGAVEHWSDELRSVVARSIAARGSVSAHPSRLRDSETRLQMALDAAAMGTFVWHVPEARAELDSRMLALLGLRASDPLSMSPAISALIHPDDRQRFSAALRDACDPRGDGLLRQDIRVVLADGTLRWLGVNAKVQFEGSPREATRMSGAAVDISERKNLEAALRENTLRVQTIISQAATGVVEADASGRMTLVNRRWCEMLGYDEGELLGMNIAAVTHPESVDPTLEAVRRLAKGGPDFEIEKKYCRKDGSILIATSSVSAIRGPSGEYRGLIAIVVDITSRKHAEEALRQSEERFRQFGDASSDVLWLRDVSTYRWIYLSKAFESIYGVPCEELIADEDAHRWLNIVLAEDRDAVSTALERVRQGAKVTFEFRIRRPNDGEVRWIHETAFPVIDPRGAIRRIGGIGQDVSEEKHTSGRLQVLVEELQHRTRNIVAVVRSLSNKTLEESTTLEDFQQRFNERLGAVSRTQGLLSRLEEGQRITFDELLDTELSAHRTANVKSQLKLQGPPGVRLRSSELQTLALAIHELVTNALKYGALSTPAGALSIRWHLLTDRSGVRRLYVDWRESGVQIDDARKQAGGYGRELIERALPYQMQAETTYELGNDGVHCTIAVPISTTMRRAFAAD